MSTITIRRGMAIGLGLAAMLSMAACAASNPLNSAGSGNGHPVAPAASSRPTTHPAVPPAGTPSATPAAPGGVQNLVISSAERDALTAAFVAVKGISPSDVGGTYPGSVYYAYDPATDTYWALAQFWPSRTASFDVQVSFQDGRGDAMFRKAGSGPWQAQLIASIPYVCNEVKFFPPAVLNAWKLPASLPAGLHC
jgi:hypothetical protein